MGIRFLTSCLAFSVRRKIGRRASVALPGPLLSGTLRVETLEYPFSPAARQRPSLYGRAGQALRGRSVVQSRLKEGVRHDVNPWATRSDFALNGQRQP